jgi:hypothetical protein
MKTSLSSFTAALLLGLALPSLSEEPITGEALERASAAALESTGGGRVTGTEVGDEEGYYEVEVTLPDGRQVDVHLDASFKVIVTEGDGPGDDERGESEDTDDDLDDDTDEESDADDE